MPAAEKAVGDDVEDAGESQAVPAESVGRVEEGEPIGPSAADEASMMGEDYTPPPGDAAPAARNTSNGGKLPSLESLVAKIPDATRRGLDEHLRARFMRVRKLKPGELR